MQLGYHTPNFFMYSVHLSFTAESIQDTTSLPSGIKSGKQITHVASDAFRLQIRLLTMGQDLRPVNFEFSK